MLRLIIAATLIFVTIVSFNNCSQPGKLAVSDQKAVTVATDPIVQEILLNCQRAQANGHLLTVTKTINFEDTRVESGKQQICDFAQTGQQTANGNLDMVDGQLRARYEQDRNLGLPDGAVLCDVQLQNDLQTFRYDDVFFFSFNGYLLASNDKTAVVQRLAPVMSQLGSTSVPFYRYDWMALRTAPFANVADDYCLGSAQGSSTCTWPITESQGNIKFSFDQELLIRLSANTTSSQQTFSFASCR